MKKSYSIAGVDGCRSVWIMIKHHLNEYTFGVYETLSTLITAHQQLERILIDMPIGLASKTHPRTLDRLLRNTLESRKSTVFNVPCRAAVYATSIAEAKQINKAIEGKSLSIQSLSLCPKIIQIDTYLQQFPKSAIQLIESHPELCFKFLNNNWKTVQSKKSTQEGYRERLGILKKYEPKAEQICKDILKVTLRKDVKKDDIVDALCLCIVNQLGGENQLSFLQDENDRDEKRIRMRIAYFRSK